jgi:hypothetical protein
MESHRILASLHLIEKGVPGPHRKEADLKSRVTILLLSLVFAAMLLVFRRSAAEENQPHMEAALQHLQQAKEELNRAEHDKGGHRQKALELTESAIHEVKEGMHYAEHEHH